MNSVFAILSHAKICKLIFCHQQNSVCVNFVTTRNFLCCFPFSSLNCILLVNINFYNFCHCSTIYWYFYFFLLLPYYATLASYSILEKVSIVVVIILLPPTRYGTVVNTSSRRRREGVQAHQYTQDTGTQRSTMRKQGK